MSLNLTETELLDNKLYRINIFLEGICTLISIILTYNIHRIVHITAMLESQNNFFHLNK